MGPEGGTEVGTEGGTGSGARREAGGGTEGGGGRGAADYNVAPVRCGHRPRTTDLPLGLVVTPSLHNHYTDLPIGLVVTHD